MHAGASFSLALGLAAPCYASLKEDVGYSRLQFELGASLPLGSASVLQVEVDVGSDEWIADDTHSEFSGKTISSLTLPPAAGPSGHATTVGRYFYGNNTSMSPGVAVIGAHSVDGWLLQVLAPGSLLSATPTTSPHRVANLSWVGDTNEGDASAFLRRSDWVSDIDELIQVFGAANSGNGEKLMATAYNGIVSGITAGTSGNQAVALDSVYVAGRPAINLVTPVTNSSRSAATVSSAATLLIDAASSNPAWSDSTASNRSGAIVYNAERIETVKAALMAGASRWTINTEQFGEISDYRAAPENQTDNGLDWRYGAGQLNVYNSYRIISSGEKPSLADGGSNSIGFIGYDHDAAFGGASSSNTEAIYDLGVTSARLDITIALVWNLSVAGPQAGPIGFDDTAELYNLDLELVDVTNGNIVVASSTSAKDNTENIWHTLDANTHYQIRVLKGPGQANFNWDYAIAWHSQPALEDMNIPLPHWVLGLLLCTLTLIHRRMQTSDDGPGIGNYRT